MKLPQRQVDDPRAQENFEALVTDIPRGWLALAAPLAAGRKIAFGSGTATWTAAVRSAVTTVPHGLGRAPVAAIVTAFATTDLTYSVITGDTTNIGVQGYYLPNVNLSGTFTFTWFAVG